MAFSFSNGLSTMGAAVADTAGREGLEYQKADLDKQKEVLANQLATTRETGLENLRQAGEKALVPIKAQSDIDVATATSGLAVTAHGKELQQDTAAALEKVKALSAPDMLAAQRAITMASTLPNYNLQIGADGSAQLLNTITGQVKPATGADGQPVKFQNPAQMQAVTAQVNALRDHSRDVDYAYRQELTAANSAYKTDPTDENKAEVQAVKDKYDPMMNDIGKQFSALTNALGVKSGIDMPAATPIAPPAAPVDPKDRKDGQAYSSPSGKVGTWNAKTQQWVVSGAPAPSGP